MRKPIICGDGGTGRDSKLTKARSKSVCHQRAAANRRTREEREVNYGLYKDSETQIKLVSINNWPIATVTFSNQKISCLSELHCIIPIGLSYAYHSLSASNWQIISQITRCPSRCFLGSHISYNVSEAGDQSGRLGPQCQPIRGQEMCPPANERRAEITADCGESDQCPGRRETGPGQCLCLCLSVTFSFFKNLNYFLHLTLKLKLGKI